MKLAEYIVPHFIFNEYKQEGSLTSYQSDPCFFLAGKLETIIDCIFLKKGCNEWAVMNGQVAVIIKRNVFTTIFCKAMTVQVGYM